MVTRKAQGTKTSTSCVW